MVTRIGVNTATAIQSSRSNPGTPSGRYQIAGVTAQGPTGSRVVRSLGEFVSVYGPRTAYSTHMHDAAALFFSEGGSELVVTRVVGPAATRDSVTIKDTAAAPKDVVKVEALAPGAPAPVRPDLATAYIDCVAAPTGGGVEVHTILVAGDELWHITLLKPETPRSPDAEASALSGLHRVAQRILA